MLLLSLFFSYFLLLFLLCWSEQMSHTSGHSMFALQAGLCCVGDTAAGKEQGCLCHICTIQRFCAFAAAQGHPVAWGAGSRSQLNWAASRTPSARRAGFGVCYRRIRLIRAEVCSVTWGNSFQLATYQSSGGKFSLSKGDDEILLYFLSAKTAQPQLQNGNIIRKLQINNLWLLKERGKLLFNKNQLGAYSKTFDFLLWSREVHFM